MFRSQYIFGVFPPYWLFFLRFHHQFLLISQSLSAGVLQCVSLGLFSSSFTLTLYVISSNLMSLNTVHMLKASKCISLDQTPL